jgi:hypothetical protein
MGRLLPGDVMWMCDSTVKKEHITNTATTAAMIIQVCLSNLWVWVYTNMFIPSSDVQLVPLY